jgi:hypothetical protein
VVDGALDLIFFLIAKVITKLLFCYLVNPCQAPVGRVLDRAGGRRREEKKKGGKERRKGKRKERKEKGRKEKKRKGRKIRKEKKENREGFSENLGKFLGRLGKGFTGFFPGFRVSARFSGTAVMARRTGHRDRGVRRIPGRWPTAALGRCAWVPAEVRCRRDSRHARRGERERENSG